MALKGLAGTTLANQGRSHEARGLLSNSAYRGDWRSPGAPIIAKFAFYSDGIHISKNGSKMASKVAQKQGGGGRGSRRGSRGSKMRSEEVQKQGARKDSYGRLVFEQLCKPF